jgi:hypothetical protein
MDILDRILTAGLPVLGILAGVAVVTYAAGLRSSKSHRPCSGTGRRRSATSRPWQDNWQERRHR